MIAVLLTGAILLVLVNSLLLLALIGAVTTLSDTIKTALAAKPPVRPEPPPTRVIVDALTKFMKQTPATRLH